MSRQEATNTFNDGMIKDMNPLTTPNTVLTDCINGTLITYNGNEFVLQNDMGNYKLPLASLGSDFIPVGIREYGNIIYIILIVQIVLFVILVLISNIDIFSYFIINVLNRDLTLTDRTVIWKITIEKIIQKPLFGNGYVYGKDFQRMLPYIIGVNAHNTYLMIMFIGGFVLFSVLIIIFIITIKKYDNRDHKKLMFILPLMLFVMMTRAQVEGGDINYIIFLVYMIYNYKNLERYTCSFKERRKQIKCKID